MIDTSNDGVSGLSNSDSIAASIAATSGTHCLINGSNGYYDSVAAVAAAAAAAQRQKRMRTSFKTSSITCNEILL